MRTKKIRISAGAILLFALMYFFDGSGVVSAVVPAAIIHELGHLLALRLCGRRLTAISISLTGVRMDYAPQIGGFRAVICFLSGPLAGILYAFAAPTLCGAFGRMSGAASFLLSVFNLLPILPLDGGRIVSELLPERQTRRISRIAALLLLAGGTAIFVRFSSFALLFMGAWLAACNLRTGGASERSV